MSDQLKIKSFIIYLEQNSSRFANAYSLFTNMPNSHIYPAIDKRTINFVKEKADSDRIFILYGNKIFPHNPKNKKEMPSGLLCASRVRKQACLLRSP